MVRHQLQQFFFFPNTPLESSEDQSGGAADFSGIPNCFSSNSHACLLPKPGGDQPDVGQHRLERNPFFFSAERNSLRVIGCGNAVLVTRSGITLAGCSSFCQNTTNNFVGNGGCFGINCCQATIPSNLNFFRLNTTATSYLSSESPCTFAALGNGFSTDQASPQQSWASIELTWMIEEAVEGSQCQKNTLNGAEVGNYTYYNCSCLPYEEGNPYLPHACQVPEVCKNCAECRKEADGSFSCVVRGSTSTSSTSPKPLILGLSFGIGGSVFLIIGSCWLYKFIKKQRVIKRKEHFFKRNGGLLLQQEMSSDRIAVEKTKIFSSEELAIATENFNKNRILGQGGQGTVYKVFGVVLVELLTGQKPIPSTRSEEERSLVAYFTSSLEQGHLFDIIDNRVMKEGGKDEILAVANLASRCLHFKGKERPTMKEVTKELEHFRTSFYLSVMYHNIHKGESMVTEMAGPLDGTSTSTERFQHDKKSSSYDV
ncbi:Wall-associated receptor kinase-like 8 [Vitis vinifera]|uniref:Wall-associated receptor kinase-like 8 n=1 Tax=Vitis vinifera TaxID=29760 RepID=A0A438JYH5_VITVI|nr:Wall-associated receptor kinase-like 8 [Vitis vinifera]